MDDLIEHTNNLQSYSQLVSTKRPQISENFAHVEKQRQEILELTHVSARHSWKERIRPERTAALPLLVSTSGQTASVSAPARRDFFY